MDGIQWVVTKLVAVMLMAGLSFAETASAQEKPPLVVFGAASLTNVLQRLGADFTQRTGRKINFSFAASSTLARQIELAGKVDVFISADEEWMDYLQKHDLVNVPTRRMVAANELVLIVPAAKAQQLTLDKDGRWLAALGAGKIALGDPGHVPAGRYAKAAFEFLGQWDAISPRVLPGASVREALAWVEKGEAVAGVVYASDARISRQVAVAAQFPADSHPPIVYPGAVLKGSQAAEDATAFLDSLKTSAAQRVWLELGFDKP